MGSNDQRLESIWPDATAAGEAVVLYVGEYEFADLRFTSPSSVGPVGVMPSMFKEAKEIKTKLDAAVAKTNVITTAESKEMSIPGFEVTQSLIDALKNLKPEVRTPATERIATELALLNALEKVNLARRLIIIGSADPNVAASPANRVINEEILPRLEMEARLLKDEFDLRDRIAKSTAYALIRNDIRRSTGPTASSGGRSSKPIHRGAVLR